MVDLKSFLILSAATITGPAAVAAAAVAAATATAAADFVSALANCGAYRNLHLLASCQDDEDGWEALRLALVGVASLVSVRSVCLDSWTATGGSFGGRDAALLLDPDANGNGSSDLPHHRVISEQGHSRGLHWFVPDGESEEQQVRDRLRLDSRFFTYKFHGQGKTALVSEVYGTKATRFKQPVGWWSKASGQLPFIELHMWERRTDFEGIPLGTTTLPPVSNNVVFMQAVLAVIAVSRCCTLIVECSY